MAERSLAQVKRYQASPLVQLDLQAVENQFARAAESLHRISSPNAANTADHLYELELVRNALTVTEAELQFADTVENAKAYPGIRNYLSVIRQRRKHFAR